MSNILLRLLNINVSRAHTLSNMTELHVTLMMMNTGTSYWLRGSLVSMKENRSGWTPRELGSKAGLDYLDIYMKKYSVSFRLSLFLKHKAKSET